MKNRMLLVDGYNIFIRCYSKSTAVDGNGNPIGGVMGFLQSIRRLIKQYIPETIICFDGPQSARRKRKINGDYKHGRRVRREKVIRNNFDWQFAKLQNYLQFLPVRTLTIDFLEADDVIAYLCAKNKDAKKIIYSSDMDYYQLIDENTSVFVSKKKVVTGTTLREEFNIPAVNWGLARSLVGDKSDNIPGMKGIGYKRVLKMFPMLSEDREISLDELFKYSKDNDILIKEARINTNFELINLRDMDLMSSHSKRRIERELNKDRTELSLSGIRLLLLEDHLLKFIRNYRGFILPFVLLNTKLHTR